jgi:prefoldin subunit 5
MQKCFFYFKLSYSTQHIFVNLGLNFYVKLSLKEALEFIEKKENYYNKQIEETNKLISSHKVNLNMIYSELMS